MKALDADAYEPFNEIHYRFSGSEDSVITDHFEIDSTTGQITVLKTLNDLNEEIQVKIWKLIKVVVTFYLRLRNEFHLIQKVTTTLGRGFPFKDMWKIFYRIFIFHPIFLFR